MIRFVVSDTEAAVAGQEEKKVSEKIFSQIVSLKDKGVLFGIAGSASHDVLSRMFSPVRKDILYITNSGASVLFGDEVVFKSALERRDALDLIREAGKKYGVLIFGEKSSYVAKTDVLIRDTLKEKWKDVTAVDDYLKIKGDFTKIALYDPDEFSQEAFRSFHEKWGERFCISVSDPHRLDFTAPYVNKGSAVATVQKLYGISEEDTVIFGDSYDSMEMFDHAYFSYALAGSMPDVKQAAKHITTDVETILDDILIM